jgi:DNA ligase-1
MMLGDLGEVACLVARGESVERPRYFLPLRYMLASPVADADEAVRRMGEEVWVEDKYDGIRCQLHHAEGRVALYSRDLNDVTEQFPEVADAAGHIADVILDGEILAFRAGRVLPFHDLQNRLGRRNPSKEVREAVPVIYVAWDVLLDGEESLLDTPLRERRRRLEELSLGDGFALAHLEPAVGATAVDDRFTAARARRNEGLMLKDPDSAYTPGRRGLAWLKLKRPLDTLDVVVVGAEWGHGKRRGVLSDVTFAVRDSDGALATVGKAYTGLTDVEIAEMTALLHDITMQDNGYYRTVRPQIVLEVAFDAVQRSSRHGSGYALRFPRIARWRHDKPVEEIDTVERVAAIADSQAHDREQLIDPAE